MGKLEKLDCVSAEDLLKNLKKVKFARERQFGDWHVFENGDLQYKDYYLIDHWRLEEDDWILHLMQKNWMDWNEFIPAYIQALRNKGIQFVKIKAFYQKKEYDYISKDDN